VDPREDVDTSPSIVGRERWLLEASLEVVNNEPEWKVVKADAIGGLFHDPRKSGVHLTVGDPAVDLSLVDGDARSTDHSFLPTTQEFRGSDNLMVFPFRRGDGGLPSRSPPVAVAVGSNDVLEGLREQEGSEARDLLRRPHR